MIHSRIIYIHKYEMQPNFGYKSCRLNPVNPAIMPRCLYLGTKYIVGESLLGCDA